MANEHEKELDEKLNSALNLMRRMPPSSTENSLAGLLELAPDLTDELLTHVDQPLKTETDNEAGKDFVLCDYNRDGDSYRSPFTNKYFPPMEDGFKPNERLRELEVHANALFAAYLKMYFNGGYSSAYFFETADDGSDGFGACFLVHKDVDKKDELMKGVWDSIHVFEVVPKESGLGKTHFEYKLTTTVMISLLLKDEETIGNADLSGLRTQQHNAVKEKKKGFQDIMHVYQMGQMLEDCETRIRNELEKIYIQKTRTVISGMRGGNQKLQQQWGSIAASLEQAKFHNKKT